MRFFLPIIAALLAGACATNEPIHDVVDARIIAPAGTSLSIGEVRRAIERAGRYLGWQMSAEGPGLFTARRALRSHLAVVEIEHDSVSYSIRYRDSVNLDAENGWIHKNYNQWVENLEKAIRTELGML